MIVLLFLALKSAEQGKNPIIIDNTHTQSWEMRYYIVLVSCWRRSVCEAEFSA